MDGFRWHHDLRKCLSNEQLLNKAKKINDLRLHWYKKTIFWYVILDAVDSVRWFDISRPDPIDL